MFDHGHAARFLVPVLAILIIAGVINASVVLRYEPCVVATEAMSPSERYFTVRNCLSKLDDEEALRLGFRTAMAGDVQLWGDSIEYHSEYVASWAVPALQHPEAERLIDEAAVGAADYTALIHPKRSRYFSDESIVSGRQSHMQRYRKIVTDEDFATRQQIDLRWLFVFLLGGGIWFVWQQRSAH